MTAPALPLPDLAYGAFTIGPEEEPRLGVAAAGRMLDLAAVGEAGLLGDLGDLVHGPVLNPLLAAGRPAWTALRRRLAGLLAPGSPQGPAVATALVDRDRVAMHLPVAIGDYVDFYSSLEHATNLGRLLRPEGEPLPPNWRHLPAGYHGRSSTVVVSGTPVRRPQGQSRSAGAPPTFGPTGMLDFEAEVGFVVGPGNRMGEPIAAGDAAEHVFGVVLVNDWSARDLQAWEYQPLGPFLSKSFATSVSPWVVPLDGLAAYRVDGPAQEPPPLEYLRAPEPRGLDLSLRVLLRTPAMAEAGQPPAPVSTTTFAGMYWTWAQQLAHLTVAGAAVRPGDLFASGAVSGPRPGSEGSMMELTAGGARSLRLPNGETRTFLEDGDEVVIRGWAGPATPPPGVGLGSVAGRIQPAG